VFEIKLTARESQVNRQPTGGPRSPRWTSLLALQRATTLQELYLETEPERRLYQDLRAVGMWSQRPHSKFAGVPSSPVGSGAARVGSSRSAACVSYPTTNRSPPKASRSSAVLKIQCPGDFDLIVDRRDVIALPVCALPEIHAAHEVAAPKNRIVEPISGSAPRKRSRYGSEISAFRRLLSTVE